MTVQRKVVWVAALSLILSSCTMGRLVTDEYLYAVEDGIESDSVTGTPSIPMNGHYAPFGIAELDALDEQEQVGTDVFVVESEHIVGTQENQPGIITSGRNIPKLPFSNDQSNIAENTSAYFDNYPVRAEYIEREAEDNAANFSVLFAYILHFFPFVSLLGVLYSIFNVTQIRKDTHKRSGENLEAVGLYFGLILVILAIIALCSVSYSFSI